MFKSSKLPIYFVVSICLFCMAQSADARNTLDVETDMSLWWVVYEESENGIIQAGSLDEAAQATSGFNIKQGRVVFYYEDTGHNIGRPHTQSGKEQVKGMNARVRISGLSHQIRLPRMVLKASLELCKGCWETRTIDSDLVILAGYQESMERR